MRGKIYQKFLWEIKISRESGELRFEKKRPRKLKSRLWTQYQYNT